MPFLRPTYLLWTVAPAGVLTIWMTIGAPHFIWSYSWRETNARHDFSSRYYVRCTYVGMGGNITEYPNDGRCGWIRFGR
ncbi:hypothetical protein [Methylocella sp.]|uniref:hypothetical protein n=1 Tax=Methylocella sp. TaxID=1978226 RepID=UPI003784B4D9